LSKKILIVGGTGFIGSNLATIAIKKGWIVTSISLKKPKKKRLVKKVKYIQCDISNKIKLKKCIKKNQYDYVINCGGHVDHKNKKKVFLSHYIGCKNLTDFFIGDKLLKSFIQIGSSVEYGNLKSPHKEKDYLKVKKTNSYYGDAKLKATKYLMKKYKEYKFSCKIIRVYLCYGPKQDLNRFIPQIIQACKNNQPFNTSSGKQYRDFIYIDDLTNLIFLLLKDKKHNGEIFNAGSGKPIQLKKLVKLIQKKCGGGKPNFGKIGLRKDESIRFYSKIDKAKKKLKWKVKTNLKKGISSIIQNYYE
jgi:nucleoside-diphosphate-sugar epimerase